MPLPAILAALARVGAGVAARAGASGAARSLLAMSRAAGPSVARRAAAKQAAQAAASKGTAAATTQAAEGLHVQPGNPLGMGAPSRGAVVLENTKLTNARALFQAIHGQTPPAGATVDAAAAAAPGAQVQAAAATAQQAAVSVSPGAQVQSAAAVQSSSAAAQPPPPAAPPPPSAGSPPAPAGGPQPSAAKPQTLLDRTLDAFRSARDSYERAKARFTPIADQVAGMTVDQRYGRLQQAGKLSNLGEVARHFGTPSPSREQHVQHSEDEEERQRQEAIQNSRGSQIGHAAFSAGKRTLAGALGMMTPAKVLTSPVWLYPIIKGFETLGRTVSETNRDLRKFDERISDSFARLDYAQLRSRQQVARATSGSATFLNDQLGRLIKDLQPFRESITTFINLAGSSLVLMARAATLFMYMNPAALAAMESLKAIEKLMRSGKSREAQAATKDFLREIRDGTFGKPKNKRPGHK